MWFKAHFVGKNYLKALGLGFLIWFVALVIVRLLNSSVFSVESPWLIVLYVASFPAGIASTVTMR